jgi:hypothetical protein
LIERIEETLDIRIDDVIVALATGDANGLQRLRGVPARTEAVATRLEIRFKDRLEDDLRCHLYHAVLHGRNAQRPLFAV